MKEIFSDQLCSIGWFNFIQRSTFIFNFQSLYSLSREKITFKTDTYFLGFLREIRLIFVFIYEPSFSFYCFFFFLRVILPYRVKYFVFNLLFSYFYFENIYVFYMNSKNEVNGGIFDAFMTANFRFHYVWVVYVN